MTQQPHTQLLLLFCRAGTTVSQPVPESFQAEADLEA